MSPTATTSRVVQARVAKDEEQTRVSLRALLAEGDIVHTLTEHTRGETDYVRVFIVIDGEINDISGRVAITTGIRFVNNNTRRGLALKGSGYNKGQEVYESLKLALGRGDLKWRSV